MNPSTTHLSMDSRRRPRQDEICTLITDHGLHRAALKLGVSKLALMNASIGGALYSKTQQAIRKAREAA